MKRENARLKQQLVDSEEAHARLLNAQLLKFNALDQELRVYRARGGSTPTAGSLARQLTTGATVTAAGTAAPTVAGTGSGGPAGR
jgi:hypothetical protein